MMSILTALAAATCIVAALGIAGRVWRHAPTPTCALPVGPIMLSHAAREDAAKAALRWGVRREPGLAYISGPRTVLSFVSRRTPERNGWYRVAVNVPGVRFKLGPLRPTNT